MEKSRKEEIQALIKCARCASKAMTGDCNLNQFMVLLTVAKYAEAGEELDFKTLADEVGLTSASVSRLTSNLTDWNFKRAEGLKLVETKPDLMDRRRYLLKPTARGTKLINQLLKSL